MKFTVSDALAERLLRMQMYKDSGTPNLHASEEENLKTTKEWIDRYSVADRSCKERFIRRKYPQ